MKLLTKILVVLLIASIAFIYLRPKPKCSTCEVRTQTVVKGETIQDITEQIDCGAKPGMTVRKDMVLGRWVYTYKTIKCF